MSGVFRFKLDPILDVRMRTEDQKAQELAAAQRHREELRRRREELEAARVVKTVQIGEASDAGESVGQLKNLRFVLDWIDGRIQTAHAAESEATTNVSTQQDAYSQAVRDRMTLDRLKDRRRVAWDADQRRAEQNEMDEIATTRHEAARRVDAEERG
jgi:flagellar protein FliJ